MAAVTNSMAIVSQTPDRVDSARTGTFLPDTEADGRFGQETDNRTKYGRTNRIERLLLERFRARLLAQLEPLRPGRILDAGCGEGHVTAWLAGEFDEAEITGVDGRAEAIAACRARGKRLHAIQADLRALPFPPDTFDLVLCTEVLEHVVDPSSVLRELARVSSRHMFITVPHEPFFRIGNLVAGRYLDRLGSTPGHVSTWGRRGVLGAVSREAEPLRWVSLFPWQGVLARPARTGTDRSRLGP